MILYPPAKINLGLNILRKREDAYHDIDTCMVEIPFTDILEVTKADSFEFLQDRNLLAVKGVDLEVRSGEILGIAFHGW
jgi:4-diphosphocytidyl-2-C-methyl-D-erythritol kinase